MVATMSGSKPSTAPLMPQNLYSKSTVSRPKRAENTP